MLDFMGTTESLPSLALLPDEIIHDRNIPLKPTRIPIWANDPHPQTKWPILRPSQRNYHTCSSLRRWSDTHKRFLHAVRPHARTGTPVQATNRRSGTSYKKTYPSKNVRVLEMVGQRTSTVAQVTPTAEPIGKEGGTQLLLGATQFTESGVGVFLFVFVIQA